LSRGHEKTILRQKNTRNQFFEKKAKNFFKNFLLSNMLIIRNISQNRRKLLITSMKKKLLKNLPVSKMAVPLHRFSPLVRRQTIAL